MNSIREARDRPWGWLLQAAERVSMAGMTQWIDCCSPNPKVTGSIPSQDTCLGYRPGPQLGACQRQPHTVVSLPLSPSLLLCLKVNK